MQIIVMMQGVWEKDDHTYLSATAIARAIGLQPSHYVREMCQQLVSEGYLTRAWGYNTGCIPYKTLYRYDERSSQY
jgi:hypothetical protein